jgi:hypothetical protein
LRRARLARPDADLALLEDGDLAGDLHELACSEGYGRRYYLWDVEFDGNRVSYTHGETCRYVNGDIRCPGGRLIIFN